MGELFWKARWLTGWLEEAPENYLADAITIRIKRMHSGGEGGWMAEVVHNKFRSQSLSCRVLYTYIPLPPLVDAE